MKAKITIRAKLVLAISILVIILFSIASYLFISEKRTELAHDIYVNSLAFSRLTAPTIAQNYDLYMEANSFVYFNRDIASIFQQNDDISDIKVISYEGEVLYDSSVDVESRYVEEPRRADRTLLKNVQSRNIGIRLLDGSQYFVKVSPDEEIYFVDEFENRIEPPREGSLIDYFVVPATEKYSIYYGLDYSNLDARIARMQSRIIYLAVFGVMLGIIMSMFMAKRVTRPVADLVEGAQRIAKGNFSTQVYINTNDELSYLGKAFNKMAIDLEAGLRARLYQERKTTELEMATKIQQHLIPKEIPSVKGVELAASIIPAGEIGGDIYDFLSLSPERVLMYLGDVTGHGIPAGIVSSIANSLMYGYSSEGDLKEIISRVNRVIKAKTISTMFMTMCVLSWDGKNDKLTYCSAGHEQLIHYKALTKKTILEPSGGMALGMIDDVSNVTKVNEVDFAVGDYVVLYSDGIPEAWKSKDETYGMERFQEVVAKFAGGSAEDLKNAILKDVKDFCGGYEQMDDITIMVIKRV